MAKLKKTRPKNPEKYRITLDISKEEHAEMLDFMRQRRIRTLNQLFRSSVNLHRRIVTFADDNTFTIKKGDKEVTVLLVY